MLNLRSLSQKLVRFDFRNPSVVDHPLRDPQDISTIVDPRMMPPLQIHFQRPEHLCHPLRMLVSVFYLEVFLDVDQPFLEVGNEQAAVGFCRGICGGDLGELLGKHCTKVPGSAGYEGVRRGVVP